MGYLSGGGVPSAASIEVENHTCKDNHVVLKLVEEEGHSWDVWFIGRQV